ncbi:MAG: potassium channel family protein [Gammaproteobacteria bacterium]|nr:potassium channel family protein [Gammaproteobacteria bacterium]
MATWIFIRRLMAAFIIDTKVSTLLLTAVFYYAASLMLMTLAGEAAIVKKHFFFYYLVVTGSSVGYGDLAPKTIMGRYIVALWVIPMGLLLFGVVIARLSLWVSGVATMTRQGLNTIKMRNHIVIIGWNEQRTYRLIELLHSEANGKSIEIILCVTNDIENPMPGKIGFVRVDAFTNEEAMERCSLAEAERIIIDSEADDVTLTTALFCRQLNPACHKTAYFKDESIAKLLKTHCPKVECVPSVAVEMLAKATLDPGSSQVTMQLLDSTAGITQYSSKLSIDGTLSYAQLLRHLYLQWNATLLGIKHTAADRIDLNADKTTEVTADDIIYYISTSRLDDSALMESLNQLPRNAV